MGRKNQINQTKLQCILASKCKSEGERKTQSYRCSYLKEVTKCLRITPDRGQSKSFNQSTNVNQKLLEIEFLIAICRLTGDKWQSKTLFLAIIGLCSSMVQSVFDCRLFSVRMQLTNSGVGIFFCYVLLTATGTR